MAGLFFEQVYALVRSVPVGQVTTYGEIARALGTKDARKVGFALHANRDPLTPCHRVVNQKGGLAKNFAFDGAEEQFRRLSVEGVEFIDQNTVDLSRCMFTFKGSQ